MTVVQKHLLENASTYDDETLARFMAYVDELRNYLQAANPQLFAPPPQPEMMPTDETALLESMAGELNPPQPMQGLSTPINNQQLSTTTI